MLSHLFLSMAALRDDADLGDWIWRIVVGVFVVGIPLIKGILQSIEKSRKGAEDDGRRTAREKASQGRRAFEELMRGGTTLAPPPLPTAPPLVPSREAETAQRGARPPVPKPLSELEELSDKPLTGSEFEAEEGAQDEDISELAERRERDELRRQQEELRLPEEIAREEYAAASPLRDSVAPVPVEVFRTPAVEVDSAAGSSQVAARLLGKGSAADRRAALRRALVLNEVLGRPVSMRDGSDAASPFARRG